MLVLEVSVPYWSAVLARSRALWNAALLGDWLMRPRALIALTFVSVLSSVRRGEKTIKNNK